MQQRSDMVEDTILSGSFILGHPCTVTHADASCLVLEDSVLTCICHIGAETAHLIHDRARFLHDSSCQFRLSEG